MEKQRFAFPSNGFLKSQWLKALNMTSSRPGDIVCQNHFDKSQMYTLPGNSFAPNRLLRNQIPQRMFSSKSHVSVSNILIVILRHILKITYMY